MYVSISRRMRLMAAWSASLGRYAVKTNINENKTTMVILMVMLVFSDLRNVTKTKQYKRSLPTESTAKASQRRLFQTCRVLKTQIDGSAVDHIYRVDAAACRSSRTVNTFTRHRSLSLNRVVSSPH
jgi:hypothetical protein